MVRQVLGAVPKPSHGRSNQRRIRGTMAKSARRTLPGAVCHLRTASLSFSCIKSKYTAYCNKLIKLNSSPFERQ